MSRRLTNTNNMNCAPTVDSDQPGPSARSDQSSLCTLWVVIVSSCEQQSSDQSGCMPRLIWVFPGHTGHFVGFAHMIVKEITFELCQEKTDLSAVMLVIPRTRMRAIQTVQVFGSLSETYSSWTLKIIWVFAGHKGHFVGSFIVWANQVP